MDRAARLAEIEACRLDPAYFIWTWMKIEQKADDGSGGEWLPFHLWPAQFEVLADLQDHQLVVVLKARQLGLTWLALGWLLWRLLFQPGSTVGVFSRREEEAIDLIRRMRGSYRRLPRWMRCASEDEKAKKTWSLSNGSRVLAFPTSAGDSYTFNAVLVDEADLCPDLAKMIDAAKPTIDGGGKMLLLSKSDKGKPASTFKRFYRQSSKEESPWHGVFLPWTARPGRDEAWYQRQVAHSLDQDGTLDFVTGNYPRNAGEAMAPSSSDKRFPAPVLAPRFKLIDPVLPPGAPVTPGLVIHRAPRPGREYVMGADPAEGLRTGDDSGSVVLDKLTGEEVATLAAKLEPKIAFPAAIADLTAFFSNAPVLIERNNHGHAVIAGLLHSHPTVTILCGPDGREGWPTTAVSKVEVANTAARSLLDCGALIHDERTYTQVAGVSAATLKHHDKNAKAVDDLSDAWMLAQKARELNATPLWGGAYSQWE